MSPTALGTCTAVEVALRPEELVAAWRPEYRRLVLLLPNPPRLQQRLAVRLTVAGLGVAATITGRVVSAAAAGNAHRTELVPDDARVRAVEKLVSVACGETVDYQPRAPRYLATLPAVVHGALGPVFMTTVSVSERGCSLAWTGPVPAVGAPLEIRLGAGSRTVSVRSVVAWTSQAARSVTVGVRFDAGTNATWRSIFGDVERSGALPA